MAEPFAAIAPGWDVFSAENDAVGVVQAVQPDYLHVQQRTLFTRKHLYFPPTVIQDITTGQVWLTLTRAELAQQDWSTPPGPTTAVETATLPTTARVGTSEAQSSAIGTSAQEVTVPLAEERLAVEKRQRTIGEVLLTREVTERTETIPVELAYEEVQVARRPANRAATDEDLRRATGAGLAALNADEPLIIPIIEEVVEVQRRLMVREELVITKQHLRNQRDVTETVRQIEPHIETTGELQQDIVQEPPAR